MCVLITYYAVYMRNETLCNSCNFFLLKCLRLTFKIHFYVKICRSQEKWSSCSLMWQKLYPSLPLAHHWQESSPDALAHSWDEAGRYHRRLGTVSRRRAGQRTDTDVLSQAWLCWTLGFLLWQLIIYFSFPWFVCLFFCWFKKINEWLVRVLAVRNKIYVLDLHIYTINLIT